MIETDQTIAPPLARFAQLLTRRERFRGDGAALSTGELASLARLDPDLPRPHQVGALARALVLAGIEPDEWQPETWQRWALLAHGIALSGNDAATALGTQFARAGVSESRVTRLLTARDDAFRSQVPRLARLLASRNIAPNWIEFGRLILASGRDETQAEALRLRIAGRYFAEQTR